MTSAGGAVAEEGPPDPPREATAEPEASSPKKATPAEGDDEVAVIQMPGSHALPFIAVILSVFAIYYAQPVLVPLAFAWIAKVLVAPALRPLQRWGVPIGLSATVAVLGVASAIGWLFYEISGPAELWLYNLPSGISELQDKLGNLAASFGELSTAAEAITDEIETAVTSDAVPVKLEDDSSALGELFASAQAVIGTALVALVLMLLLLIADQSFLRRFVNLLPGLKEKKIAVAAVHSIEENITRFLTSISLINLVLGLAIGLSMWGLGMPNPLLWGLMAAVLNFVPYLGPLVGATVVAAAAVLTFDSVGVALVAPIVYLAWNAVEGMVITPIVLGRSLTMSPVILFLWLVSWTWLWGIPGALLATPLLAVTKIVCDSVPRFRPIGQMIAA